MSTESVDYRYNEEEDDGEEGYIKVAANEDDDDAMEFPTEEDDTIMFSTIQAQFPNSTGIKYKGPSGAWRAIRAVDNILAAPKGGWGRRTYFISVLDPSMGASETKKRKAGAGDDESESKHSKFDPLLKDLPVTGLPYKTTGVELREYFEKNYGELTLCEIKTDRDTGKSRGFGFIRFKNIEAAREAVNNQHRLDGRSVTVKVKTEKPMKLFIGRLARGTTSEELEEYFSKFGKLDDVYVPTPFRNFAFITYASTDDGRRVLRGDHEINGSKLNVEERKSEQQQRPGASGNDRGFGSRQSSSSREESYYRFNSGRSNSRDQREQPRGEHGNIANIPNRDVATDLKTLLFHYLSGN